MRNAIEAIHERNDLDVINSELRREIRTLKAELNNAEIRIASLLKELGRPVVNADWTDKPDGDGHYWMRLHERDQCPEIVKVEDTVVFQMDGPSTNLDSPIIRHWQWQKVKPCEG